jgi:hypothetical protein
VRSRVAVIYSYTVGYHALYPFYSVKGTTCAGFRVRLAGSSLQERHLYSRTDFKLNRAAALAEWCQLLSAQIGAVAAIQFLVSFVTIL